MQLTQLPSDLLQRCFASTSLADRCRLACTCRRLAASLADPGFWQTIELDVGRLKIKGSAGLAVVLTFLTKRASRSTLLRLFCSAPPQKAGSPPNEPGEPHWKPLYIVPLLTAVGINPGLAGLDLDLRHTPLALQRDALAALPWLAGLRALRASALLLADAVELGALAQLADLRELEVAFSPQAAAIMGSALQGGFPDRLTSLCKLRRLAITGAGRIDAVPEGLGALTLLTSLDLGGGTAVARLPASLSRLSALRALRVEQAERQELAALARLPSLAELHLACGRVPVELAGCSALTALTLLLSDVPECQIEPGFSAMLGSSPPPLDAPPPPPGAPPGASPLGRGLRVLHVADTKLGSVPQAVAQLRRLQHLSLSRCALFDLPPGPYTLRLQTLRLKHNFFIEVPRSLAGAAPCLARLDLSHNLLRPSEADVGTVLRLPRLQHLWVAKTAQLPGSERFRQSLTGWTAYAMDCLFRLAAAHAGAHPGSPLRVHVFEPSPPSL